jgi:hypothetical protein
VHHRQWCCDITKGSRRHQFAAGMPHRLNPGPMRADQHGPHVHAHCYSVPIVAVGYTARS